MMMGLLGILKAGGAYVPLDPNYPAERQIFMLEDAAVRLVVTEEKQRCLVGATQAELICVDSGGGEIALEREENIDSGVKAENLAYVIYTSGSTGRPKGAMITHKSVVNLAGAMPPGLERWERVAVVVDADDERRRLGRERFRQYRERGIQPQTHDMKDEP